MNNSEYDFYKINVKSKISDVLKIFEQASVKKMVAGIAIIVNSKDEIIGCVTEGDIRRALISGSGISDCVEHIYQKDPILFNINDSYSEVLDKIPLELKKRRRRTKKFLNKIIFIDEYKKLCKLISYHQLWEQKVAIHRHIVVLGLGYVGLTLAVVLAEQGFMVTGVDVDSNKIKKLKRKESYVHEIGIEDLIKKNIGTNLNVSNSIPSNGDVFIISVGTPVQRNKKGNTVVNTDYIKEICSSIASNLRPGNLVILRSTVPVGLSRKLVIPILEKESGLLCGKDFHLSFAPERTAEGKAIKELKELPQIIGGFNEESLEATAAIFRELTPTIIRVSDLETAETIKLVNNSFRDVVFSYSNYVAQIASKFNIDINEVIYSANYGYPRDKVPYPSPGVGGPCLTKDPYIFSKSLSDNSKFSLFEHGRNINESMHSYIYEKVKAQLEYIGKDVKKSKIFVCGLAFKGKPETGDIRNSSAVEIYKIFDNHSTKLFAHDPVATSKEMNIFNINHVDFEKGIKNADVVLFLNNNYFYEKLNFSKYIKLMNDKPIIFDGWNIFSSSKILRTPCIYMNLSKTQSSIK